MRGFGRWVVGLSLWVPVFVACGSKGGTFNGAPDDSGSPSSDDGSGSGSGSSSGYVPSDDGPALVLPDTGTVTGEALCKGGQYNGTFTGTYSSHLTLIGLSIPVSGNVSLNLHQEGSAGTTCTLNGESEDCSQVFSLQDGTITGVADGNEAGTGGFPYFCTMTGTLDCAHMKLVGGWIQCTYCVGALNDGGTSCVLGGGASMAGLGGWFSGILTANYDIATSSFIDGGWNGAESLGLNDGGTGPDGGPSVDYLNLMDGGYGLLDFGGSGGWNAKWQ